jgi:hypothetical protein
VGAVSRTEEQAVRDKSPCKGCESRTVHPNCHAACAKYAEFINDHQKYAKQKRENEIVLGYIKERKLKRR